MSFTAIASINLSALRHNLTQIRRFAPTSKIIAMVKANAYGHGLIAVSQALSQVDALGVARINEAVILRKGGIKTPIILLEGFNEPSELDLIHQYDLGSVIHHQQQMTYLQENPYIDCPYVWIKLNTGMNRLGFPYTEAASIYHTLKEMRNIKEIRGVMTHFASAEEQDRRFTQRQYEQFMSSTECLPVAKSLANSAAIIAHPITQKDWIRPGLMLYGVSPFHDRIGAELDLIPVMEFSARLMTFYRAKKGDRVGYNGRFTCPKDMLIGIVSAGYGDGYPRYIGENTPILVAGVETQIIGRVSMDMLAVNLDPCEKVKIGDKVTLWGQDLPIEHIAAAAKTSPYELLAGLTGRVEYEYTHSV